MRRIVLLFGVPLVFAIGIGVIGLLYRSHDPVPENVRALMSQAVDALVADDADALFALIDPSQQTPVTRDAVPAVIAEAPAGRVLQSRRRSEAETNDEDGRRFRIVERYRFEGGVVWITFDIVDHDDGARLMGLGITPIAPPRF